MKLIDREIERQILQNLIPQKVLVLLGPRRVGKTVLIKKLIDNLNEPYLLLNGEDFSVLEVLSRRSTQQYKNLLEGKKVLIIDEAQKIPEIGNILKLMIDEIEGLKILVTGSSAFDIDKYTGEPLTGRKKTFHLFPLSESEYNQIENTIEKQDGIRERLIYGNYPELVHIQSKNDKADYLKEIVNSYLLKDILAFENIRNSDKILNLLRLVAFQVGSEVSYQELGKQLGMSKNTIEKYLDLLSKVFVLHKLGGFSRNLRKEITKNSKWYFYDNGLRNLIIANLNPIESRNDIGQLWENYAISERIKSQRYNRMIVNNYFWRTYDQQEIDWVEERDGKLYGYDFKWNVNKNVNAPTTWANTYTNAEFKAINPENFSDWLKSD
ncbi:MAG: ATP-binding protein [Microscillaceae bacterium]|nr:ATP-binding protein [Microscillaceae bacterium]